MRYVRGITLWEQRKRRNGLSAPQDNPDDLKIPASYIHAKAKLFAPKNHSETTLLRTILEEKVEGLHRRTMTQCINGATFAPPDSTKTDCHKKAKALNIVITQLKAIEASGATPERLAALKTIINQGTETEYPLVPVTAEELKAVYRAISALDQRLLFNERDAHLNCHRFLTGELLKKIYQKLTQELQLKLEGYLKHGKNHILLAAPSWEAEVVYAGFMQPENASSQSNTVTLRTASFNELKKFQPEFFEDAEAHSDTQRYLHSVNRLIAKLERQISPTNAPAGP